MKRKTKVLSTIILLVALGVGFFLWLRPEGQAGTTEAARRGTVAETVSVTGELTPEQYADLGFPAGGEIASISVEEGETVQKGQIIASLDAAVVQAQLSEAQVALEIAIQDEWLARRHDDRGLLDPEQVEAKKLASEAARKNIQTLATQIGNTRLRAPFSGIIASVDARAGEPVGAGARVARLVGPESGYVVEADVPESDIAKLRIGMPAEITFDALPDSEIFSGEVLRIAATATNVDGVVSYVTAFRIPRLAEDPALLERLRDGMTADIDIVTERRENVVLLPYRALRFEGSQAYVLLAPADPKGEPVRRDLVLGLEGGEGLVEVVSGLSEGENVLLEEDS